VASTAGPGTTNQLPVVTITAPTVGATFTASATIAVAASATDTDGSISRVDFYSGSTLLGSDTSSPYELSWANVAAGIYSLKAIAVDNTGASTTSAPVAVTVNPSASVTSATLAYTPSADNSTNVTSYRLDIFVAGANPASATPVTSQSLGMPPITNGDMSANIQQIVSTLPSGSYFGTVTAIGPGGTTRSAPSNTFTKP
jgi:hypothetical protein